MLILFFILFYFLTLQYCIGFAIYQHESATGIHVFPILNPPPSSLLYHPSGSSQCTSPKHPLSCIEPGLLTHFIYGIIHVSMPFSQTIPPSPSPTESKRLFYTSMSLLLSHIQGYCYHLSKFHIYALVYCIGVFLSGLLHSVLRCGSHKAKMASPASPTSFWVMPILLASQHDVTNKVCSGLEITSCFSNNGLLFLK